MIQRTFFLLSILHLAASMVVADLVCTKPGECIGGLFIDSQLLERYRFSNGGEGYNNSQLSFSSEEDCLQYCKDTPNCTDYSYEPDYNFCMAVNGCPEIDTDFCTTCVSGNLEDCDGCYEEGHCLGPIVGTTIAPSAKICQERCEERPNCNWFSYYKHDGACSLTSECSEIDTSCLGDCWYGKKECEGAGPGKENKKT